MKININVESRAPLELSFFINGGEIQGTIYQEDGYFLVATQELLSRTHSFRATCEGMSADRMKLIAAAWSKPAARTQKPWQMLRGRWEH